MESSPEARKEQERQARMVGLLPSCRPQTEPLGRLARSSTHTAFPICVLQTELMGQPHQLAHPRNGLLA